MFARLPVLIALVLLALTSSCGSAEQIDVDDTTVVVDVRTPEEFAGGHLAGAVNLDVGGASFADEVAALDPAVDYVVYCQSGNRSAAAAAAFEDAGLTVTDAGGIDAASDATGLDVVTG